MAKKKKLDLKKIGHYSFIAGLVLAVLMALIANLDQRLSLWILIVLGILVGLLNITSKETTGFLIASVVLMISASATALNLGNISVYLTAMWGNIITFVAFAAIVVAIKTVYQLAQD